MAKALEEAHQVTYDGKSDRDDPVPILDACGCGGRRTLSELSGGTALFLAPFFN